MLNETFVKTVTRNVKSRQVLVNVVADLQDSVRLERHLEAAASMVGRNLFIWNMVEGLTLVFSPEGKTIPTTQIESIDDLLDTIASSLEGDNGSIYYIQDLPIFLVGDHSNPLYIRKIAVLAKQLKKSKSVIVTASDDLLDGFVNVDLPLPKDSELKVVTLKRIDSLGAAIDTSELTDNGIEEISKMMVGLSENEARTILNYTIVDNKALADHHIKDIATAKAKKLGENEALELVNTDIDFTNVGGLDLLKTWIKRRSKGFSEKAKEFGLKAPKGVGLLGIPGMGKSLVAKAIANELELPLINFDIGAIFGELVGQSERQLRETLKILDTLSPCVLWIDELDKAFSQGSDGDSGTSKRVLGKILTWLQESTGIFVVATANNPQSIPTELLRKGRFDEIFFMDLPSTQVREEIFKVHLQRVNRNADNFDVDLFAKLSAGFVGSEIEAVIDESLYIAFEQDTGLTDECILTAINEITPMSQTHSDTVNMLRQWANNGQCRLADKPEIIATPIVETAKPIADVDKDYDLEL